MNEILAFLSENWYVIVMVLVLLFAIYYTITNKAKAKEWLRWCVTVAENELGKSTGQPKLRMVYDMFIEKFPVFSSILPFNIFSKWVDVALEWMREQIDKNEAIKAFTENN